VAVLHKGKIAVESAMGDLKYHRRSNRITLEYENEADTDEILRVLRENNLAPTSYNTAEKNIENLYMEVAKSQ
jgi:hypothetical protein